MPQFEILLDNGGKLKMTVEERLTKLETKIETMETEIKNIRELVVAVEKIATKVETIEKKVDGIDKRITNVEIAPAKKFDKYKELIASTIISLVLGGLIGALLALLIR